MTLNLTIGVTDLDSSKVFYRDLLGLRVFSEPREQGGTFLLVDCGNCMLALQPVTTLMATHPVLFQNFSRYQPGNGVQFELTCYNLETVMKRLEHHQWPIHYELDDQERGRRELWVQDPDGYLLILNQEY
jgi:catechol 2,3-dioxygenase-like lactoylglutathione lyase family enzyme